MNESDMAMYDAFQKLLREDGHLKQSDIFAFRLGWRECRAAQQSMHLTDGILPDLQAESTSEQDTDPNHSLTTPIGR